MRLDLDYPRPEPLTAKEFKTLISLLDCAYALATECADIQEWTGELKSLAYGKDGASGTFAYAEGDCFDFCILPHTYFTSRDWQDAEILKEQNRRSKLIRESQAKAISKAALVEEKERQLLADLLLKYPLSTPYYKGLAT